MRLNSGAELGGPDWTRFPRLQRLRLHLWESKDGHALSGLFPSDSQALLGGLEELDTHDHSSVIDAPTWATILRHTPALTTLRLAHCPLKEPGGSVAVLAVVGALAPRLACLEAPSWRSSHVDAAEIAARLLPALSPLSFSDFGDSVSGAAAAWHAPLCSRLTALSFHYGMEVPSSVFDEACWPLMHSLSGIALRASGVVALASGLPTCSCCKLILLAIRGSLLPPLHSAVSHGPGLMVAAEASAPMPACRACCRAWSASSGTAVAPPFHATFGGSLASRT